MKKPSESFERVPVNQEICSDAEQREHLAAFLESFVQGARVERARHLLHGGRRGARAARKLNEAFHMMLGAWLREDRVTELAGSSGFPQYLRTRFGAKKGIFIDENLRSCRVSAPEAACLADEEGVSAVLSLEAGRSALIFHEVGPPDLCVYNPGHKSKS